MALGWRRRIGRPRAGKKQPGNLDMELVIPTHFKCPISLDIMKDPVTLSSGITYDRESIEKWLEAGNYACPVSNQALRNLDQIPNHTLRKMIQVWCVENQHYGIERMPTPRVPITPIQVSEALLSLTNSIQNLDQHGCSDLLQKIKKWGNESERNKRCIIKNGAAGVLAAAFEAFATNSSLFEQNADLLEEILCALNWMLPCDFETETHLSSRASLRCMVWLLKRGNVSTRKNTISELKEILSCGQKHVEALAGIEGVNEVLVKLIREQICPTITKNSLMVTFLLVSTSSNEKIRSEFIEVGMISILLEILVDSERSIAEKALGVFDRLCSCENGMESAYNNALTVPVLVKKILRVSELATEFSVCSIWRLCKYKKFEGVVVEALQVGAFQKLLLVLQVGCGDETKEKVSEILKILNPYMGRLECIESVDFKSLKRSF